MRWVRAHLDRIGTHFERGGRLPEPIFTPATKAETGHDVNIEFEEMARRIGAEVAAAIDLDASPQDNVRAAAGGKGVKPSEMSVGVLDRGLGAELLEEAQHEADVAVLRAELRLVEEMHDRTFDR